MENIEAGKPYFIPVPDTDTNPNYQQTCEIPTIYTKLKIPGSTIIRLRFPINPEERSPLDVLAGGENLEIAGERIRAQMIHRLETALALKAALATMQNPKRPLSESLKKEIEEISKYFVRKPNVLPCL